MLWRLPRHPAQKLHIAVSGYSDDVKPARNEEALALLRSDPEAYFRKLRRDTNRDRHETEDPDWFSAPAVPQVWGRRRWKAFWWGVFHPFGPPRPWWSLERRIAYLETHGRPWEREQ